MFKHILPDKPGTEPLAEALRACRSHFVIALVFSALVNLLYLTPTIYMMQVYDRVVPTAGHMTLLLVTIVTGFALLTLAALDTVRTRLLVRAGLRLDRLLAHKVLGRVIAGDGPPERAGQAMREFDNVKTGISGPGALALMDAPWTPVYLIVAFMLHWVLGVLTLFGAVILFLLAWLNEKDTRPRLQKAIQAQNRAYAAQESIAHQNEVVRALGMRSALTTRQINERSSATAAQADAAFTGGRYSGSIKFVRLFLQSLALGLGALLAIDGQISAGAIIAASVLLSRAVAPVEQLVGAWPGIVQARTSWKSLTEMFAAGAGKDRERTQLPPPAGNLAVDAVSVRFKDGDNPQLKSVNFRLNAGESLGIIGASGSGKTTLARVIAGALKPGLGVVRLDGADYDSWDQDRLGRHIGYLPQSPSLFAGSIKENISRFQTSIEGEDTSAIDARVVAAAQAAGVHDLIQRLPGGYDAVLGPNGAGLSAGQGQRVALARAFYGDPALIVLDEPNSNLDQEGEQALSMAIARAAARGATVVVVAHRLTILGRVDKLLVMRDGAVEMMGPRDEVMQKLQPQRPQPPKVASVQ